MLLEDILAAIPLGFFLSFLIGPVFFVLLETSVVKGFRAAICFDLGAILGDIVFILIAYFSSYRLIEAIKDDPALFIFGGLVMLTYGIINLVKNKKIKQKYRSGRSCRTGQKELSEPVHQRFFPEFYQYRCAGFLARNPHCHGATIGVETG